MHLIILNTFNTTNTAHLHIYVLDENTLQLYFWYTKLVYLIRTTNVVLNAY